MTARSGVPEAASEAQLLTAIAQRHALPAPALEALVSTARLEARDRRRRVPAPELQRLVEALTMDRA